MPSSSFDKLRMSGRAKYPAHAELVEPDADEVQALRSAVSSLQAQNAVLRQIVVIHDRLGALVLQGADVTTITRMTAELVGRRVLLLDALLQVVTMALPVHDERPPTLGEGWNWAPQQGYVRAVLATLARERRPLRVPPMADFGVDASCVLAPVAVGDSILGYLAILAEGGDGDAASSEDLDLQIVQHAATVYALSMMRERVAAEVARQLKDEVFEGLLSGRTQDEQVARERAIRLGYNPAIAYRVLVIMADDPAGQRPETAAQRRRLLETLAELCTRHSTDGFAAVREDALVVLVGEPVDARELGRTAVQQAAALLPDWRVTVGVSGTCANASAIARSYAQARRALETAQRFGHQSDVVAFEDLGVYVEQVLGPLIEYDQRHNADFVRTLETFLAHNGNLQATARELTLHVNSVTYRVQRIQSIANLDLEQSEDRLLAQMALKILGGL